jgi:hypothetical protein
MPRSLVQFTFGIIGKAGPLVKHRLSPGFDLTLFLDGLVMRNNVGHKRAKMIRPLAASFSEEFYTLHRRRGRQSGTRGRGVDHEIRGGRAGDRQIEGEWPDPIIVEFRLDVPVVYAVTLGTLQDPLNPLLIIFILPMRG